MLCKHTTRILILILQLVVVVQLQDLINGDYIPTKLDGFVYGNHSFNFDTDILIEAFYDPLCPYSNISWPPLKQALHHYGSSVSFLLHLLPLPFHDNAFDVSRALHVVNALNRSATFPLLESFFKYQEKFYGGSTRNLSKASIEKKIVKFAANVLGRSYYTSIKNGFNDRISDIQTRVSFRILECLIYLAGAYEKYLLGEVNPLNGSLIPRMINLRSHRRGHIDNQKHNAVLRGVYGTPFFYANGFLLPDREEDSINYWRGVIDPLIGAKT